MKKILSINTLRVISIIEGLSYLALIFIGMPLKYGAQITDVNKVLGMGHGILTIIFCIVLGMVWFQNQIRTKLCVKIFVASLIPFGAFWAEKKMKAIKKIDFNLFIIIVIFHKPTVNRVLFNLENNGNL
tara:strand:+ start:359 stop:745 length:387 start_codon:yes stop_codon:yes gene_type:complete